MTEDGGSSYELALAELANVEDPADRALVLSVLAVMEELGVVADAMRGLDETASAARPGYWLGLISNSLRGLEGRAARQRP